MRFRPRKGFEADIERMPGMQAAESRAAAAIARRASQLAPKGTKRYSRSLDADQNIVKTDDIAGHIVEFGSVNNPPYAPLRRAVRSLGLRFREDPR